VFKDKKFWTEGWGSLAVAVAIALFIRWLLLEAYVIPSGSMLPSLLIHDHIFVNKLVYGVRVPFSEQWLVKFAEPKRGEVIVFKYPEDKSVFFIKRIVGVPGDKVFYENGTLYINDKPIPKELPKTSDDFDWLRDEDFQDEGPGAKENYVHWTEVEDGHAHSVLLRRGENFNSTFGPVLIPPDQFFAMGDNRNHSRDSRFWGNVPRENILGRASFVWLSCEDTLPNVPFLCNPLTVRWLRFFHVVE
jgi:signal peptidase I